MHWAHCLMPAVCVETQLHTSISTESHNPCVNVQCRASQDEAKRRLYTAE